MDELDVESLNPKQLKLYEQGIKYGWDKGPAREDWLEEIKALATVTKSVKQTQQTVETNKAARRICEAEAVHKWLHYPGSIIEVTCRQCKRKFGTDYQHVRHCSPECLQISIEQMGIKWDPTRSDADRYDGEPPAIISPDALAKLKKWAKAILSAEDEEPINYRADIGLMQIMPDDTGPIKLPATFPSFMLDSPLKDEMRESAQKVINKLEDLPWWAEE